MGCAALRKIRTPLQNSIPQNRSESADIVHYETKPFNRSSLSLPLFVFPLLLQIRFVLVSWSRSVAHSFQYFSSRTPLTHPSLPLISVHRQIFKATRVEYLFPPSRDRYAIRFFFLLQSTYIYPVISMSVSSVL